MNGGEACGVADSGAADVNSGAGVSLSSSMSGGIEGADSSLNEDNLFNLSSEQAEIINRLLYHQEAFEVPTSDNITWVGYVLWTRLPSH